MINPLSTLFFHLTWKYLKDIEAEFPLVISFLANDTMRRSLRSGHLSMQKTMKIQLKMTIQLLKVCLELVIYRCNNDEHKPKNGDFNWKNDESIPGGDFITIKPMKAY